MAPIVPRRKLTEAELFEQGLALQRAGRLLEAERYYQTILAKNPDYADANNGMGILSVTAGQLDFAIGFFERALKQKPKDFGLLNNLGNVLVEKGRTEDALPLFDRALALKPKSYELLCNIGRAYKKMGVAAKGLPYLRRAVEMRPTQWEGLLGLGDSLVTLGENEEAERCYRLLLEDPVAKFSALYGLASCRKQTADRNISREVSRELAGDGLSLLALTQLHYAAAKVDMDLGKHDEAWEHLTRVNALSTVRYDRLHHEKRQKAIKALLNPAFMASRRDYGSPSERPVFVVGMPRSGTSLTEQILSSHPAVVGAGELTYMLSLANSLFFSLGALEIFSDQVRALSADRVRALAGEYLAKIDYFSPTAARITDKMPHNFARLGLIGLLFPKAKFIYCKRDPMDNCFSIYSNMLNETHSYANDLDTLGWYYRQHVDLMDHWKSALPGQILEVQYEQLVEDVEGVSRKMIDFIGLDWDPACLKFFETERTVATLSKWQVRQPIYKTSVARWKAYEKHLGPLIAALNKTET